MKNPVMIRDKKTKPTDKEFEEIIKNWKKVSKDMPGPVGYVSDAEREKAWKRGCII